MRQRTEPPPPQFTPAEVFERGMPADTEAEKLVLGSILLDGEQIHTAAVLAPDDFSIEKHRVIFTRMTGLHEAGRRVDRISLINELRKFGELESVDGMSYLLSLDDALPKLVYLENYIRIVREKSQLRKLIYAGERIRNAALIGEEHPDSIRASGEEALLSIAGSVKSRVATVEEIISEFEGGLNAFLNPSKHDAGIKTGYLRFDEMTGGLRGSELLILAARPSMGKTSLALNIAQNIVLSKDPVPVTVFSLEMSRESLLHRMACGVGRVDMQKFRHGYMNSDERRRLQEAMEVLSRSMLLIDDTAELDIPAIRSVLIDVTRKRGKGLAIVDYLQLITTRGKTENRTQEVGKLTRGLKILAKSLDIPILVLSQLSRATETRSGDHRPQLSDLRESGSIENDADLVAFVFREEYYHPDREDLRGQAELLIAKQRSGPTGKVPLVFLKEYTKFENRADGLEDTDA